MTKALLTIVYSSLVIVCLEVLKYAMCKQAHEAIQFLMRRF